METLHDKGDVLSEMIRDRLEYELNKGVEICTRDITMGIYYSITNDEDVPQAIGLAAVEGIKSYIKKEIQ